MNKYQNDSSLLSHLINENVQLHREILKNMETIEHLKSREYYLEKKVSELKEILRKVSKLTNLDGIKTIVNSSLVSPLTNYTTRVYNTHEPMTYDGTSDK